MATRMETVPTPATAGTGTPVARHPHDPFVELREHMDRLFGSVFGGLEPFGWSRDTPSTMMPRVDVGETDVALTIKADLPGMDEKDVELTLDGGVLTLKGERTAEKEEKDKNHHVMERSHGSFVRSFRLPDTVDPDKVTASFDKGVLTVTLPKTDAGKREVRRIAIGSGEPPAEEIKH